MWFVLIINIAYITILIIITDISHVLAADRSRKGQAFPLGGKVSEFDSHLSELF